VKRASPIRAVHVTVPLAALVLLGLVLLAWMNRGSQTPAVPDLIRESPTQPTSAIERNLDDTSRAETAQTSPKSSKDAPRLEMQALPELGHCSIRGVVLVRKLRVDAPAPNILVELIRDPPADGPLDSVQPQGVIGRRKTGVDGTFSFEDLKGSGEGVRNTTYRVLARLDFGSVHQAIVRLSDDNPSERVNLLFGTGRIHGTIHDVNGKAVQNAALDLDLEGDPGERRSQDGCATDRDGRFEFSALPAGRFNLTAFSTQVLPPDSTPWATLEYHIELAEADDLALGSEGVILCSRLHGSLTGSSDTLPERGPTLELERQDKSVGGSQWTERQNCWMVGPRARSTFDFYVEPGVWRLTVSYGDLKWTAHGPFSIEAGDAACDIAIPPHLSKRR
jgi:hypothetical protein